MSPSSSYLSGGGLTLSCLEEDQNPRHSSLQTEFLRLLILSIIQIQNPHAFIFFVALILMVSLTSFGFSPSKLLAVALHSRLSLLPPWGGTPELYLLQNLALSHS